MTALELAHLIQNMILQGKIEKEAEVRYMGDEPVGSVGSVGFDLNDRYILWLYDQE